MIITVPSSAPLSHMPIPPPLVWPNLYLSPAQTASHKNSLPSIHDMYQRDLSGTNVGYHRSQNLQLTLICQTAVDHYSGYISRKNKPYV